ncbi:MAG: transglycosylase SLT domain-containing protein [Phycisphaerae bacterium]|nr:transglycosylase SLT domain-containing protein [Phycisphaerae bacterium]
MTLALILFSCFLPGVGGCGTPPAADSFEKMLDAIAIVESGNNPNAVNDNGKAIGVYQIWPIYVDDANRIAKKRYTYADRKCPVKSREMVRIVLKHYGKDIPFDKWPVIHISPSKRKDFNRPAAVEYLRKINEATKLKGQNDGN